MQDLLFHAPAQVNPVCAQDPEQSPPHPLSSPHSEVTSQVGAQHSRAPFDAVCRHCTPAPAQGTLQTPPQPLLPPHDAPVQFGTQPPEHTPAVQMPLCGQVPWQRPPQPSGEPHAENQVHVGSQTGGHSPAMHSVSSQPSHSQLSTHSPSRQNEPSSQFTPAQGFVKQTPPTQTDPFPHSMSSHGSGGAGATQVNPQALPSGHGASQAETSTHSVSVAPTATQRVPSAHSTFAQVDGAKHPSMHSPPTQVFRAPHTTPVHGSAVGTQAASQALPSGHSSIAPIHGSAAQAPPRHASPAPQSAPLTQGDPMEPPAPESCSASPSASSSPASRSGR